MFRFALLLVLAVLPGAGFAVELTLPASARQTAGLELGVESYALPTAPFDGENVPARVFEGFVTRQAWRVEGAGVTPLQLMQPLRSELKENGYTLLFECSDRECGGFDFRFSTEVVSAPDMFVDLDDYRFVAAIEGDSDAPKSAISLLISRSDAAAFIQITQVSVDEAANINVGKGSELTASAPTSNVVKLPADLKGVEKQFDVAGHVILSDLVFETGSSKLGEGPFASLNEVAAYLRQNPDRKIALVGHTDAQGRLQGNIALSKKRADSVVQRLINAHGVDQGKLSSQGVGFLAPIASNLTDAGRDANRRVEAVLTSVK